MKRIVIISLLLLTAAQNIFSQTQSLQVIYITKDYTSAVTPLCLDLKDIYSSAIRDRSQAVVFYLANASSPIIVRVNLPDDNRQDMDRILDALISKSETIIDPGADLRQLVGLFDEIEIAGSGDSKKFTSVELTYYVTPTFWDLKYNEQVIAPVYFALDMDSDWAKDYLSMSIYHEATDGLQVDEDAPFGVRDLCKGHKFFLMSYSN